ncbi:MAG: tyrosine-type recombinase/integrase [Candidatus Cryptobacteroides sp.]
MTARACVTADGLKVFAMENLIDGYIEYISGVKRYSARTQQGYRDVLGDFRDYLLREVGTQANREENGRTDRKDNWQTGQSRGEGKEDECLLRGMTSQVLRGYEVYLMKERKLSARSVGLYLSVLSSFAKYLMKKDRLSANPVRTVARPKVPKRLPEFYRKDSIDIYFEQTRPYGTDTILDLLGPVADPATRELYAKCLRRLIISILYNTGIRRSELISLDRSNFDPARRVLHVRGKGDKMREIPLTPSLCEEILLYLKVLCRCGFDIDRQDSPLLLTPTGRRLYPQFVDKAVKQELGAVPGISGRKSPHVLRHTIATELLDEGTDINSIKELLGHSSLAATQVYTHNSIEKLKKVYNRAHPRSLTAKKT